MPNISPGVYTKIIDLSTYVAEVPGTIGLICGFSKKGEDNVLKYVGGRSEFIGEFGEPNIADFGKNYGQGPYCAYNYLGESGSLYYMRVLPDDAAYSNMVVNGSFAPADATASITISYIETANTTAEIKTGLETAGTVNPICVLYPIGRGVYYNGLGIRFSEHSNPILNGVYVLDIYERQSDGEDIIIESFEVSFDPKATDLSGDSIFIEYVLATYSSVLRADMVKANGDYSGGYQLVARVYDQQIGTVTVDATSGSAQIEDTKQSFTDWLSAETGNASYVVLAKDSRGNQVWGWLGNIDGADETKIHVFADKDLTTATRAWNGSTALFDSSDTAITYEIKKSATSIATAFVSADPVPLRKGSDGSLLTSTGDVDPTEATQLLANAYAGTIDDSVLDTENVYFSIVFDCGYPTDVKTQIVNLAQTRRDCVALVDNGDTSSYSTSLSNRQNVHTFNTYYAAIYEEYNKVYDIFTGQDVWFSPIFHMSYLVPRNDQVAELWYAVAGFNRAAIDSIKELRFNPKLAQRDGMYLKQLNPIVKFNEGYTVWGNLTSQAKASALQDLNIVRLVLYCKRALEQYCRFFIFEMNDSITWSAVAGNVIEFLENVKRRRGLYNYSVEVSATAYEIKKKTFHVNVTLQPTRVVEKIELNFFIQ